MHFLKFHILFFNTNLGIVQSHHDLQFSCMNEKMGLNSDDLSVFSQCSVYRDRRDKVRLSQINLCFVHFNIT